MDAFRKGIIAVFGVLFAMGVSILVMIKGWGLEPKSWWWIIGISFFGHVLAQSIIGIGLYKDKGEK